MFGQPSNWPYILLDKYDFEMTILAFYQTHKRLPTEEEMSSEEAVGLLDHLKGGLRSLIQGQINRAVQREASEARWAEEDRKEKKRSKLLKR